jgi:ubiquinone/menaquinone biosynthesis C-methylase UbiE
MREYRAIARRIGADRPARVLDWGCGWGQVSALLHEEGLDVTSFDYSPNESAGLRPLERFPPFMVHVSPDPRRLPFDDGAFDAVLSCGVLEHVEDPDASLEEIKRVLATGGRFYVYKLPNRASYLEALAKRMGLYYHGAYEHDRVYSRRTALELFSRHGYVVLEFRRMNMVPLTLTGAVANRAAKPIWTANKALSMIPGLNALATNLELVARAP